MGALVGDRYEIVRELGRGGMGEVLLARQLNLGRLVVLKRVLPEHPQRFVTMLLEEARVAARLHHPSIISVLDVSADGEPAFVAMEYVAGATLRELIQRSPGGLPLEVSLVIALDVLRGLAYAHGVRSGTSVGIVHRDVKPRNIMVSFAGTTKLIDFGISRWLADDGGWESTSISGTQGYMAPEQQLGQRVDGRADQYAMGVTLREMLTGAAARDGDNTTPERPHAATASAGGPIEPALAAILDRMCASSPDDRYEDCAAAVLALESYAAAHDLSPSPSQVEKWMNDHLADEVAAWERDAERASEPNLMVARAEPSSITVASGEPERRPRGRERTRTRTTWILAGAALAVVGTVVGIRLAARPAAVGDQPLVVALSVRNLGTQEDEWLRLAVEHVARRAMRDVADRRYWLAPAAGGGTALQIELAYRHTPTGIHLEARRGSESLASTDATSVVEAVEQISVPLAAALGADRPVAGPDPIEAAEMVTLGARSYDEYRRFRILFEEVRIPGWNDSLALAAGYEALVREDPAWGHPYAELHWLYGRRTDKTTTLLRDAHAHVDRSRGSGLVLLEALELETRGKFPEAVALTRPVFDRDNTDMLAGEIVVSGLSVRSDEEASAVNRRLLELYPSLYYAGDIADGLHKEGRDDEAERLTRDSIAANPDNLTSARELVRIEARHGDRMAARRAASRALLIHGERPTALAELFEMMVTSGDLSEAQRIVDRMLLGSALSKARGHYRTGVIAVFQGRFNAASQVLREAVEEFRPYGWEAEIPQCLELLRALSEQLGDRAATISFATQLVDWFSAEGSAHGSVPTYRYQLALAQRGSTCPPIEDQTSVTAEAEEARQKMRRAAAAVGCASCKDVVSAGLSSSENSPESLLSFGRCARSEGELELARRSFERATQLWSSWNNRQASAYHAVLAHFELAGVLAQLGDRATARAEYERFVELWGRADHAIPEVADAERALATFGSIVPP